MKKFVSVFLTAAMAAASLTGCQSGGSSDALTPVTLNEVAHSIFYAPQYAAIELGYFKDVYKRQVLVRGQRLPFLGRHLIDSAVNKIR